MHAGPPKGHWAGLVSPLGMAEAVLSVPLALVHTVTLRFCLPSIPLREVSALPTLCALDRAASHPQACGADMRAKTACGSQG